MLRNDQIKRIYDRLGTGQDRGAAYEDIAIEDLCHHAHFPHAQHVFEFGAAVLEVAGDAIIRTGVRGRGLLFIVLGALILGGYGVLVNSIPWDFSRLLGVYVGVFALVGVLMGRYIFHERIPLLTWLGLLLILAGGLIIQFGGMRPQ